jgi:hypothetical protein
MAKRKREGQTIPWPREKEKDRQYHGQEKDRQYHGQEKDRQYHGQEKKRRHITAATEY